LLARTSTGFSLSWKARWVLLGADGAAASTIAVRRRATVGFFRLDGFRRNTQVVGVDGSLFAFGRPAWQPRSSSSRPCCGFWSYCSTSTCQSTGCASLASTLSTRSYARWFPVKALRWRQLFSGSVRGIGSHRGSGRVPAQSLGRVSSLIHYYILLYTGYH
jgi:hypothetical protein